MTETKKILLIGRSGRGKSTLANVLLNKNNNFEEVFKESYRSVSETKKVQFEEFEDNNTNYLVIDTPGIGDTKMSDNEVLDIIAEAVYRVKDGLSQVLFVVGGRFDQSEMATYNLLRTIIFDEHITNHTTITRARFANFRSKKECQEDIKLMKEAAQQKKTELESQIADNEKKIQSVSSSSEQYQKLLAETEKLKKELKSTLSEIIESCQDKVVHVDNPPVRIRGISDEDSKSNKKKRNKSRERILKHLNKICQEDYNPEKLQKLSNEIADDYFQYLVKKEELEAELKKIKVGGRKNSRQQSIGIENSKDNKGDELVITEEEKEISEGKEIIDEVDINDFGIGERIVQLENKKEKLQREIQEKEKVIRQKVLKHIFNNYRLISQELGGEIFLNSIIGDHDWEKISQEFSNKELVVKWLSKDFDYNQVQKWVTVLGSEFNPKYDVFFCTWLRDDKQLTVEKIKELSHVFDIEQLRKEYVDWLEKETKLLEQHNQQLPDQKEVNDNNFFLKGTKSDLFGSQIDGSYFDDLEEIKSKINNESIKEIKICQIIIRHGTIVDSIQLSYRVTTDNGSYLIKCDRHGGMGGRGDEVVNLGSDEWILKITGETCVTHGVNSITGLVIWTVSQGKLKKYGLYGSGVWTSNREPFELPSCVAIFGRGHQGNASYLLALGVWESNQSWQELTEKLEQKSFFAQEWLDQNYSKDQRWTVKKLDLNNQNLKGDLDLSDFIDLEESICYYNYLTNLIFNCPRLKKINCHNNQLTTLEINQQTFLTELDCKWNPLTTLIVANNPNLTEIDCSDCQLSSLQLTNNPSLKKVRCFGNRLTNLVPFSQLLNCERLDLSDNPLSGSLESLKGLRKLKRLDINNTKLDSGLEWLLDNLEKFYCGGTKLARGLEIYGKPERDGGYDNYLKLFQTWKEVNQQAQIQVPLK